MEHRAIINSDIMLAEFQGFQTHFPWHPMAEGPGGAQLPGRGEAPPNPWGCRSSRITCISSSPSWGLHPWV